MTERGTNNKADAKTSSILVGPDARITKGLNPLTLFLDIPQLQQQMGALGDATTLERAKYHSALRSFEGKKGLISASDQWKQTSNNLTATTDRSQQLTEGDPVVELLAVNVSIAGAQIPFQAQADKLREKYRENGYPIDGYMDICAFFSAGAINIRIGDVSLKSIHDQERRTQLPVSSLLEFFIEMRRAQEPTLPRNFLSDNDSDLAKRYPQILLYTLTSASTLTNAVLNGAYGIQRDSEFDKEIRKFPSSASSARRLLEKGREFHRRLGDTLTDPEDPDFENTKAIALNFGEESARSRNYFIHLLTLSHISRDLRRIYRASQEMKASGKDEAFFDKLGGWLYNYTDVISDFAELYTEEDVEDVFEPYPEAFGSEPVPPMTTIRTSVASVIRNKPGKTNNFEINQDMLSGVNWGGIVPPHSVKVFFAPGKPMDFHIELGYEKAIGEDAIETKTVKFIVDVPANEFDWNFIEDPDSTGMKPFSETAKHVTVQVLGALSTQLAREKATQAATKREQQKSKTASPATTVWPAEPTEKTSPAHRKRKDRSFMEALEESVGIEDQGTTRMIVIPEEDSKLLAAMPSLPPEASGSIRDELEALNRRGVTKFKMLAGSHGGSNIYSARMGNLRVLLRESGRDGTVSRYEIVDVGDRSKIYRQIK